MVEFKKYLRGASDAGSRLMFRSGTHGLNEELGKYRGRECPAYYSSLRSDFLVALQERLGDGFEHFQSLDSFSKANLFWVVSSRRKNLVLCLTLLRVLFRMFGS